MRGREIGSLLMHAFAPITHVSSLPFGFLYSFSFSSLFTLFSFLSFYLSVFLIVVIPPPLFTTIVFYTTCRDRIYHFYPSTTFGSLWVSFQDCPQACWLPSHHHYTMLAAPCLIPKKSDFVLSLTSLNTHPNKG